MYTRINFKSKKALKEAVAAYHSSGTCPEQRGHRAITYYQPGPFAGNEPKDGTIYLEGPHYPEPHKWYAQATVENGIIVKVK